MSLQSRLKVKGFRWTVVGTIASVLGIALAVIFFLLPAHSSSTPQPVLPKPQVLEERGYTVILDNASGDPMPDTVVQLIGDGGPYSCTTDSNGVCTIQHMALLPSLSARILSDGKKLYETNVPTNSPANRAATKLAKPCRSNRPLVVGVKSLAENKPTAT